LLVPFKIAPCQSEVTAREPVQGDRQSRGMG
jgi:hypothetical protein